MYSPENKESHIMFRLPDIFGRRRIRMLEYGIQALANEREQLRDRERALEVLLAAQHNTILRLKEKLNATPHDG